MKLLDIIITTLESIKDTINKAEKWQRLDNCKKWSDVMSILPWEQEQIIREYVKAKVKEEIENDGKI